MFDEAWRGLLVDAVDHSLAEDLFEATLRDLQGLGELGEGCAGVGDVVCDVVFRKSLEDCNVVDLDESGQVHGMDYS